MVARVSKLPPGRRRPDAFSLSGKIIGWLVENGAVMTLCNLRSLLPHPEPIADGKSKGTQKETFLDGLKTLSKNIAISVCSNLIAEEGAVFLHHLASTRLYSQVPYFTKQNRSANPLRLGAAVDWFRGNAILQLVGGGIFLGFIESLLPSGLAEEANDTPFSVTQFLKNFGVFRIIVDIVFYCGHRTLHEVPWLYEHVHKRHHEHFTTNLRTNYHFTAPDLFIESALPIFAGVAFLRKALGVKLSRYEVHLYMTYVAWHESGTHLGKPLPVVSSYPPLSILYNAFTDFDRDSVEFHEVHHNRRHTNYGITQWIDKLMGSHILKSTVVRK
jgi:sterol desaturase/sphingolipid hydroxylase (fatty acid hydroxylase superfamily)